MLNFHGCSAFYKWMFTWKIRSFECFKQSLFCLMVLLSFLKINLLFRIMDPLKLKSPVQVHARAQHCCHLLLKCSVATNTSHLPKVPSRWLKNHMFAKKCILISFWIFQYCFHYSFTLYFLQYLACSDTGIFRIVPYLALSVLDLSKPSGCQTIWI